MDKNPSNHIDPAIIKKYRLMGKIQRLINGVLADLNDTSELINERYIVTSRRFQDEVSKARVSLNITGKDELDDSDINYWVARNIKPVAIPKYPHITDAEELSIRRFWSAVSSALKDAGLPNTWRTYLAVYIITDAAPRITDISAKRKLIEVKNIDENSITIRLTKGLRYDEYINCWSALSGFLGKGRRKTKLPDVKTRSRDLLMYEKHLQGFTQRELAIEFFSTDVEYARDAVKKALKRQKKLFDEGTDLAK